MHNLKKHSGALDGDPGKDYVLTLYGIKNVNVQFRK